MLFIYIKYHNVNNTAPCFKSFNGDMQNWPQETIIYYSLTNKKYYLIINKTFVTSEINALMTETEYFFVKFVHITSELNTTED